MILYEWKTQTVYNVLSKKHCQKENQLQIGQRKLISQNQLMYILVNSEILLFLTDIIGLWLEGYYEKKLSPTVKDKVISFGYYGIGRWDNGKLDEGEFQNIKNNFTTWLLSKRWGNKVLISVKPMSFWVYLHIKLK